MSKQIPINTITPSQPDSQSDGYKLRNYVFKAEESGLNFYAPGGQTLIKSNITPDTAFPVNLPGVTNPMQVTVNSYSLIVSGSWTDVQPGITGDPGSGTFQAQAGGGGAEDEDYASSAKA